MRLSENTVENSEISQVRSIQHQDPKNALQTSKISPKQQDHEVHTHTTPKLGEISPKQQGKDKSSRATPKSNEISPKEPHEVNDLVAMEEGAVATTPSVNTQHIPMKNDNIQGDENQEQKSPQVDTAQHYLDDNFSYVMRSSALGSNVSSLFNTTAFNTTQNEQRVMLDCVLPDSKNSQL